MILGVLDTSGMSTFALYRWESVKSIVQKHHFGVSTGVGGVDNIHAKIEEMIKDALRDIRARP